MPAKTYQDFVRTAINHKEENLRPLSLWDEDKHYLKRPGLETVFVVLMNAVTFGASVVAKKMRKSKKQAKTT